MQLFWLAESLSLTLHGAGPIREVILDGSLTKLIVCVSVVFGALRIRVLE